MSFLVMCVDDILSCLILIFDAFFVVFMLDFGVVYGLFFGRVYW